MTADNENETISPEDAHELIARMTEALREMVEHFDAPNETLSFGQQRALERASALVRSMTDE